MSTSGPTIREITDDKESTMEKKTTPVDDEDLDDVSMKH